MSLQKVISVTQQSERGFRVQFIKKIYIFLESESLFILIIRTYLISLKYPGFQFLKDTLHVFKVKQTENGVIIQRHHTDSL